MKLNRKELEQLCRDNEIKITSKTNMKEMIFLLEKKGIDLDSETISNKKVSKTDNLFSTTDVQELLINAKKDLSFAKSIGIVIPENLNDYQKDIYIENEILFRYPKILSRKKSINKPEISYDKFDIDKLQIYTMKEILEVYPLKNKYWDSFETMIGNIVYDKIDVKKEIGEMSVDLTGARDGDTIKGFHNITKNALVKIKGYIPPYRKSLNMLRLNPNLWNTFLEKLGSIDFFSEMNIFERSNWLYRNQGDKKDISDYTTLTVQLISSGDSDMVKKISEEEIATMIEFEELIPNDIIEKFPRKQGSKARKVSLFFISNFWKIVQNFEYKNRFDGLYFNVEEGTCNYGNIEYKKIIVLNHGNDDKIAFISESDEINKEKLYTLILDFFDIDMIELNNIENELKEFTPAGYKSLLQKIIRYRPLYVNGHDSGVYLLVTLSLLYLHQGSFVPDIQRFVSGAESFCKRLAVTIFEDSNIKNTNILSSLMISALLLQKFKQYKPSLNLFSKWFGAAIEALNSKKYWLYKIQEYELEGLVVNKKFSQNDTLKLCAHLLNEIKSFKSDIYMLFDIAKHNNVIESNLKRPKNMPLHHCVDQHWVPEIAYYFGYEVICRFKNVTELFRELWNKVVGVNTRKKEVDRKDKFFIDARNAQKKYLLSKQTNKNIIPTLNTYHQMEFEISDAYIAGMIGSIEMKTTPRTLVTLNPQDLTEFISIRKPSREMKDAKLDQKILLKNEETIWNLLQTKGLKMNKIGLPYPNEYKKILLKYDKKFYVEIDDEKITLQNFKKYIAEIYHIQDRIDPIKNNSDGMVIDAFERFDRIMKEQPYEASRRLKQILGDHKNEIEMYKISRDGSSNELIMIDFLVFDILLEMCSLFPVAIEKVENKTVTFKIKFLDLIKYILSQLNEKTEKYKKWNIQLPSRKLWNHQQTSLEKMIERNNERKRGQFIWIPVGLGKCLDPETEILTFDKKIIKAKNVTINTILLGDDLTPRIVSSTCEGVGPMFLVKQSKGINYKVNKDHILTLYDTVDNKIVDINILEYDIRYKGIKILEKGFEYYDIEIEYIGYGPYFGFTLNSNGRFLLKDLTITHNTQIVLSYLCYLNDKNLLPKHVIYTLPDSAINSIIKEAEMFNFNLEIIHPIKSKFSTELNNKNININKTCKLTPYTLSVIEHDYLRICPQLLDYECVFIVDEVHKTFNDTLRTNYALQLSHSSKEFIAMTGTVVIDNHLYKLIHWLSQINEFEVNENNFWVSVNNMISKKVDTGIKVEIENILAPFNDQKIKNKYYNLIPPGLGGKNYSSNMKDLKEAVEICYSICNEKMIELTLNELEKGNRVFLIARNKSHQQELYNMLPNKKYIYLIEKGKSITLTDDMVKKKLVPGYKIVITTMNYSAGYTLTYMNTMITSVYPSNQATREQMAGRINRIGQKSSTVYYYTVHVGILTYILNHHNDAKNLSDVLSSLVDVV